MERCASEYADGMAKTGQELAEFLKRKLQSLFEETEVVISYLGGSWAQNEQNWWSDIDIFISVPTFDSLTSKAQLRWLTKLHVQATDLTKLERIEITVLETVPPHVQFNVFVEGILIYEKDPETRALLLEKLLPFYYDHMIWYKQVLDHSKYIQ